MPRRKGSLPRGRGAKVRGPPTPPGRGGAAGRVWLYGNHAVHAALANPARRCRRLLLTPQAYRALERWAQQSGLGSAFAEGLPLDVVTRQAIERVLPPGAVHQGVALQADPLPEPSLEEACALRPECRAEAPPVVVLDQVTDPQNVGAILRSAAAFGARAVITQRRRAPEASGALAKAASGALERVPLVPVTNLARALAALKGLGYWSLGLDPGAAQALGEIGTRGPLCLVLGAEGRGLRRLTAERCDELVRLPISGEVESLNVSNAAAVALYELARSRRERAASRRG